MTLLKKYVAIARLQVAMWHVQADRGAWLVPGEGWEAFRRGAD